MPVQLNVTFNDGGAVAALEGLQGRIGNLRPAMDEVGQALQTSTHQRFLDAEDPDGRPWPELSAVTKAKRGSDAKPLRDRGNLFDSIPPRPYLGVNEDDRQEIADILRVHLGD
jgi:phage gpG-like protein